MPNFESNQLLLLAFLVVLLAVGTYVTYVRQERTLAVLDEKIETKSKTVREIENLQRRRREGKAKIRTLRKKWSRQFKIVPPMLSSADVIAYLTTNTRTGFKIFNVESGGRNSKDGYSTYTFGVEGKAYFTSLYRLIWTMENRRSFYRIQNLELDYLEERTKEGEDGRTSMDILVSFKMDVQALYGLLPGEEGNAQKGTDLIRSAQLTPSSDDFAGSLPVDVLPDPVPEVNPFYPLIFKQVPPNEAGRVNVETAQFISIVDGQAVFETQQGVKRLQEGDRVYLGRIIEVNSAKGLLRARLNRGGIIDYVERHLNPESPLEVVDQNTGTP